MKLDARRTAAFLRDPGECRVVLVHGDDAGLVRERAEGLVRTVCGSLDDPFRVVDLDRNEAVRLLEEAATLPLTGGRRVVRLRGGVETPATTAAVETAVRSVLASNAPALVVVEAGSLRPRSGLRNIAETSPQAIAIGCYPEDRRQLQAVIRDTLTKSGIGVEPDALTWLAARLGADRAATRVEIDKLALFAAPSGTITLEQAMLLTGEAAGWSLDDALFAATAGDAAGADRALEAALAEGATPVGVLRAGLGHIQRLHRARLAVAGGLSATEVVEALRPKLFFRHSGLFTRALSLWSPGRLADAAVMTVEAERACKRTGAPAGAICRKATAALVWMCASAGA